jgi:hypothetical protein
MKMSIFYLGRLAILLSLNLGLALSQQGDVTTGQIGPDSGLLPSAAVLSAEESERLMALTMVRVDQFLQRPSREGPEAGAPAGPEFGAEGPEAGAAVAAVTAGPVEDPIAALDSALGEASRVRGPQMSHILLRFLELPDPSLRITALHWLAARPDIAEEVLTKALTDDNGLVRTVALQILFERGASDEELAALRAGGNPSGGVRGALGRLPRAR